jgi:hypothetical protein
MFVSANPELVAGVSVRGLFLEIPASPPVDFLVIYLGFARVGVLYPPPGVCKLPFDALLEWSPTALYGTLSLGTCIARDVTSET